MKSGNFNGVVDEVNMLFEHILRNAFVRRIGDYGTTWNNMRKKQIVKRDISKASLGELLSACREAKIIRKGSLVENSVSAFLKVRAPERHDMGLAVVPEDNAQTAISLAESFLRHWYR